MGYGSINVWPKVRQVKQRAVSNNGPASRLGSEQSVAQATASTETGDAPGSQGATTENIGKYLREEQRREVGVGSGMQRRSNAGVTCATGC